MENHGDAIAANMPQFFLVDGQQVVPGVANAAGGVAGERVGQQAQNRVCSNRFTRAAFAHQRQCFATADIKAQVVDHALRAAAGDEFHRQVTHLNQVVRRGILFGLSHVISSGRRHRERPRR